MVCKYHRSVKNKQKTKTFHSVYLGLQSHLNVISKAYYF